MNHSKPGLNEPFYKWLDDVRRAIRKEKELKEKLAFYNVKLIGYKGVVYDRIGSAGTAGSEKDMYYWMDRIHIIQDELTKLERTFMEVQLLENILSADEKHVLSTMTRNTHNLVITGKFNRSYRYQLIDRLVMKWKKLKSIS